MKMPSKSDEPAKQPAKSERGAPFTAQAFRKNLAVRVKVKSAPGDADELPEHGYGHGV